MASRSVESTQVVTGPHGRLTPLWQASIELAVGAEWERRFELACALGMGTSGAVFEARDRVTGRQVALKILRRCEPQALLRFKQEFRVLSEIAHPNLVAVHELIVDAEQRACFSMDLVRGQTFLEHVSAADGGFDAGRLRAALLQLVQGVACLHAHGVLHRDLKPANVLIDAHGRLSLVDFGLAQRRAEAAAPGQFEGTPAYAAPEQLENATFSYESDWYGVGVMLYEALTGQRPLLLSAAEEHGPLPPSRVLGRALPADLEHVCLALLAHDPAQRPDGAQVLALLAGAGAVQLELEAPAAHGGEAERLEHPPLWGRALELQQLEAACAAAGSGAGPAAFALRGPSGIGKTSLADALLARVREREGGRSVVLCSRCFVHESVHYNAFDGIIDDLAAYLQTLPEDELSALAPHGLAALVQLFPALRACFGPSAQGDATQLARVAAFGALRQLLRRLAERAQVLLFIDDLQWADADSAQLLTSLVSSELGALWILATWRSDVAPTPPLREALSRFGYLELGPLPSEAAAALVRAEVAGCDAELAREIAEKSAGHPLHVRELIRQACEQGPGSALAEGALDHALVRRIERLTAPARALLELVCVAGRPLASSLLMGAQDAGEQAALRELRAARLTRDSKLDAGPSYVEVQHDRVRSALLSQLPKLRVQSLHARLAERLLACGASALEQAVQHQLLAGKRKEAGSLAERAAEGASERLAFHSAADLWLLALAQAERGSQVERRLQLKAAEASARAGRMWQAARLFERAVVSARSASERAELQLAAVLAYGVSGHGKRAGQLLTALKTELALPLGFVPLPVVLGRIWLWFVANRGLPRLRSTPVARRQRSLQPEAALQILWRATPSLLVVDPELSCQFAARSLRLAGQQADPAIYGQALAFHMTAMCMFWGHCTPGQKRTMQRAERLVARHGDRWDESFVHVMLAGEAAHQWQYTRAARLSEQAAAARELSTPYAAGVRALARTVLLPSLFNAGELERGCELAEEYIRDAVTCGDRHQEFGCRVVGSHRFLVRDDPQQAHAELVVAKAIELDYPHMALSDPQWETGVALYQGDAQGALARYDQLRARAGREVGAAQAARLRFVAVEACCLLACVAQQGMNRQLLKRLRRSLSMLEHSKCSAAQPVAAQVTATLALRVGLRDRAVLQLRTAADQLEALGMPLYAACLRLGAARAQGRGAVAAEREPLRLLSSAGLVSPLKWANMLAPALGLDRDA